MGLKDTIIDILKKVKCKCKCIGNIEMEIKISDSPPCEIQTEREINNNNNNNNNNINNLSLENNIHLTPQQSPIQERRSPAPLPRPHIYEQLI